MIKMFDYEDGESNAEVKLADVRIFKYRAYCFHPDTRYFRNLLNNYTKNGQDLLNNSKW